MNIKKLSSIFLAVLLSFYGVLLMSPAFALADDGGQGSGNHGNQGDNHGSVVSAVAHSHSEDGNGNHGSVVSVVAKDNHGHNNGDENENGDDQNENENGNEDGNGGGGGGHIVGNVATDAATNISSSDAMLNGMNGALAATGHSFWVSLSPIDTSSPNIPAGVYSTPDLGAIAANTAFSASLSSLTTSGVPGNLPAITPNTKYYFVAWSLVNGVWYPGSVLSFTTLVTTPPADTTPPNILFATNLGLTASNISLIWVTDEASNSNLWISTSSPVSTSTAPVASSNALSFFHQLAIPGLNISTLYYYTVGSTDSSGNTSYHSGSFTSPAI